MNFVLLKLVEYLGNSNALLSGLAYDEVRQTDNEAESSLMNIGSSK